MMMIVGGEEDGRMGKGKGKGGREGGGVMSW